MEKENDSNREINNVEDWRKYHGKPELVDGHAVAKDGSIEAFNKLRSIATDLDVNFNSSTSIEELIDMILLEVNENEDTDQISTT